MEGRTQCLQMMETVPAWQCAGAAGDSFWGLAVYGQEHHLD
jgi:hypothetical protein